MRKFLFLIFISLISFQAQSTHLMGGEITWQCLKSGPDVGKYVFTLKVYRDCNGVTAPTFTQFLDVWGHPTITQISMNFIGQEDVSPNCNPVISGNPLLSCTNGDIGAVEEYTYESLPINIPGIPPATGWHFTWDNCCRNGSITNLVLSNTTSPSEGFTLRAGMFPFIDPATGFAVPADPCFDSSPNFKEQPKTILCVGFPFSYSHNASDEELDSLVYSWGEPLDDNVPFTGGVYNPGPFPATPSTLPFMLPYSANSPLPGNPTLDSQTGEVSYNANLAGFYVTCVRVQAYRCSQLVAEVYREVQVVLIACPFMPGGLIPNNPPAVNAPFIDTVTMLPSYDTTVYAGQLVTFKIDGIDGDLYNGLTPQQLTMEVTGGQFSDNYLDSSLCLNPPCAQFFDADYFEANSTLPILQQMPPPIVKDNDTVSGIFRWQTSCMHIAAISGCGATSNVFTFLIKVYDDFCPANGLKFATIKVTVLPAPVDNSPDPRCVSVSENGNVEIIWEHLASAPSSTVYSIYHSNDPNGPFTFLDSVMYPANTYNHNSSYNANNEIQYYYLTSHSACADESAPSDTLSTIKLDVDPINNNTVGDLNWNPIHIPNLSTSFANYDIYAKGSDGVFQLVGQSPTNNFLFPAQTCNSYQAMYVTLEDQSGCISVSSIDGAILEDTISPEIPIISDVSVNTDGKSVISWTCSSIDVDVFEIYKKIDGVWVTIGTVTPPSNMFVYNNSDAVNISEIFTVRALDSCDNASLRSEEHNSINIETEVDVCDFTVNVTWNEYVNFNGGLSHYDLHVEETDQFGIITSDTNRLVNQLEYTIDNINGGSSYHIYIVAYNSDSSIYAISDQINEPISLPRHPEYNYIEYASVNHDNGFVEINCLIDNQADIAHYDIFRSLRNEDQFYKIGQTPFVNASTVHYTDKTAMTSQDFYQYLVFPVDTCGQRLTAPPVFAPEYLNDTSYAQTILLEAEINVNYGDSISLEGEYTNTLYFNEYEKWLGSVAEYRLYRSVNGGPFNVLPLHEWDRINNPDEPLSYIDIVTEYGDGNGRFCYYIQAIEGPQTPYGPLLEGAFSNIACVSQTPIIFVPSVFTPNGDEHNEVFRPITYYVSEIGYSFSVYNRSGLQIFSTNNPQVGWDGTYLGRHVQDGNYIYHLEYINGVGNLTEKTDMITIVR